jgi:class 3 adenylate cyclase
MGVIFDKLIFCLEDLDIDPNQKMALRLEIERIQRDYRDLEFRLERISRDKSTLYTLLNRTSEDLEEAMRQLEIEKGKSERLLLNILPASIADRLKQNEDIIADIFPEVSLLFADIVDFTPMSTQLSPDNLVLMLNGVFSKMDELTEKHKLEKIKTIGDAYMVAGGLPIPRSDHAEAIADMALDIRGIIRQFERPTGEPLSMRIGIHTGPVVAGIIGKKKFIYDMWGDTVNTASRMESNGVKGEIQASTEVYHKLKEAYIFENRGIIDVKGKGKMATYLLIGRKYTG